MLSRKWEMGRETTTISDERRAYQGKFGKVSKGLILQGL